MERTEVEKDTLDYLEWKRLILYGHVRRTDPSRWIAKITEWTNERKTNKVLPNRNWRGHGKRGLEDGECTNKYAWRKWLREETQLKLTGKNGIETIMTISSMKVRSKNIPERSGVF